jgi:hypothetical protein
MGVRRVILGQQIQEDTAQPEAQLALGRASESREASQARRYVS